MIAALALWAAMLIGSLPDITGHHPRPYTRPPARHRPF